MGRFVVAVDAGTTGVTALVFDETRRIVGRAYRELGQTYPQPGWVEQDPVEIRDATTWAAKSALRMARVEASQVAALGTTNQRETTIVWDRRTGTPVAPAIVWQDRRTAKRCQGLKAKTAMLRKRTGLVPDPYFSATKLEWILQQRNNAERAKRGDLAFGTVDAYLAWSLTGRHVTDDTNASRTLLFDLEKGAWSQELLELFGVPESMLPDCVPSSHVVGPAKGLGMPLAALVGDQQSALFGQGCFAAGQAKTTYGTGAFLLQHTGATRATSRHGLLATRAASPDGRPRYALEGAVFSAGSAIQWLRDQLGLIHVASEVDQLAESVPDAGGLVFVPAFTGLGAPYWDPNARGALMGITRGANRAHMARAVLESIAYQSALVLQAMAKDANSSPKVLRVDGGAAKSDLLLRMQADVLGKPVERPDNIETTATGAALLAGLATDVWKMADLRKRDQATRFAPTPQGTDLGRWKKAVKAVQGFGGGL